MILAPFREQNEFNHLSKYHKFGTDATGHYSALRYVQITLFRRGHIKGIKDTWQPVNISFIYSMTAVSMTYQGEYY